jgi:glycerol-3-phosphate acyltransferase PlsY
VYPVWLGFRGGKGVATGAGAFLPLAPLASLAALATFGAVLAATRYVSAGSIAGAVVLSSMLFARHAPLPVARVGVLLSLLIVLKHRENIRRLLSGNERRLGGKP